MTTKEMLYKHLESKGVFNGGIHPIVNTALDTISGEVPYRLKLSIALSELITLTSHMRKNIKLFDGTIVPCNAIVFALAGSGVSKDSSVNMVRKALKPAYEMIEQYRKDNAKAIAERKAILDGKTKEDWLSYYIKPRDLQAGIGTVEGLITHFAELASGDLGAGATNVSEIGSELQSNGNLIDIIKTISVAYDLGNIPAKIIKSAENQTDSIKGLPINALWFGSQDGILYEGAIKNKFKLVFNTQLARRSIFSFSPEKPIKPNFNSVEELTKYRANERECTLKAQSTMEDIAIEIIENTTQEPLTINQEAQALFDVYKEYNSFESDDMKALYPINRLARRHMQWKALKLSGNYAILEGNEEITEKNYVDAINTIEVFSDDLMNFEKELIKEDYELMCEYMRYIAEDGKSFLNLHELKKLQYITGSGTKGKVEELVRLASAYDKSGIYTACQDGICYEEVIKVETMGVSYLSVEGSKQDRAKQCASGYEYFETSFNELEGLLQDDFAYSPFRFKDGVRSADNVIGGCQFVVLDIDDSKITDEECHLLLSDINHHIARTSDKANAFKFRVLIELSSIVDLDSLVWRNFQKELGDELGLTVDVLPKSQIFFSYADRDVLSVTDAEPLYPRDLILKAIDKSNSKTKPTQLSSKQQKDLLDNPFTTFQFAFESEYGSASRNMIRAAKYAYDLGADEKYISDLLDEINSYFEDPMDEQRMENTLRSQVRRWF